MKFQQHELAAYRDEDPRRDRLRPVRNRVAELLYERVSEALRSLPLVAGLGRRLLVADVDGLPSEGVLVVGETNSGYALSVDVFDDGEIQITVHSEVFVPESEEEE